MGRKPPSFSVAPGKGIYYCFGCHQAAAASSILSWSSEGLTYPDAVRFLAKRAGLEVPEDDGLPQSVTGSRSASGRCAARMRRAIFTASSTGPAGATGPAVSWHAAASPARRSPASAWALRRRRLGQSDGCHAANGLFQGGAAGGGARSRKMNRRARCMTASGTGSCSPSSDLRGNVIGFGGRVMDDSTPKYLNSPETVIFNKRKNLFALNLAKKSKAGLYPADRGVYGRHHPATSTALTAPWPPWALR